MRKRLTRHRLTLRPRAGLAATAALVAGLTLSAGAAYIGSGYLDPAIAQSTTGGTTRPGSAAEGAHRPNDNVPAPRAMKPGTVLIESEAEPGARTNPKDHLPDTMRRGG